MNASAGVEGAARRPPAGGGRLWLWLLFALLLIAGIGWFAVKQSATGKRAELAVGYIAHVVCSCRFVGARDMASCETDREPGTEIVKVREDSAGRSITASVPLLASRTARFDPEYGCTLDEA
jgi:hypothetical protein